MQKLFLLGDEAVAQGAIDGGLSAIYAYPGTPSTEITEYVQRNPQARELGIKARWTANEKTAMETALGISYAGKRAMVAMKHVGLNVAADAFVNSAITGVNGGLTVVAADDPSMHSSQNEQDSRYYGKFAMVPILEPSNQQEAYLMAYHSFELSEKFGLPVLLRLVTRLAHSRSGVERLPRKNQNPLRLPSDPRQYVLLPVIAKKRYKLLLSTQDHLIEDSENSPYNEFFDAEDKSLGIIASGIAYNYLMENFPNGCPYPVLKIGQYPLPKSKIEKLYNSVEKILVIEEGYPFIEEQLRGVLDDKKIKGKLDGTLPRYGELNPNIIARVFGFPLGEIPDVSPVVKSRPPQLCPGCGHIDMYIALNDAMKEYGTGRVFSDIGCYTLGALPPYNAINSCVDMGASITMAKGAADAGLIPSVAVIGDSTFTHSGMTGLLDAVIDNSPITVIIADNSVTAMTGGQESHAEDRLVQIVKGLGVHPDHVHTIVPIPKNRKLMTEIIKRELEYNGVSVIIPQRVCVQMAGKILKRKKAKLQQKN